MSKGNKISSDMCTDGVSIERQKKASLSKGLKPKREADLTVICIS